MNIAFVATGYEMAGNEHDPVDTGNFKGMHELKLFYPLIVHSSPRHPMHGVALPEMRQ